MSPECTVCALFCGDYPELLERCLKPLIGLDPAYFRVRLACNALSERSNDKLVELTCKSPAGLIETVYRSEINRFKYPMMRILLNGGTEMSSNPTPIRTPWMMWLDDDSGISAPDPTARLRQIIQDANDTGADMMGSIWTMTLTPEQINWVKKQAWHSGRPVDPRMSFCTGGSWIIRTDILHKHFWPPADCIHRGGDVMLGQMMYQQKYKIKNYKSKEGLLINADMSGKECSSKHRLANFYPVGHKNANQPRPLTDP